MLLGTRCQIAKAKYKVNAVPTGLLVLFVSPASGLGNLQHLGLKCEMSLKRRNMCTPVIPARFVTVLDLFSAGSSGSCSLEILVKYLTKFMHLLGFRRVRAT